jgi:hypothetical protein
MKKCWIGGIMGLNEFYLFLLFASALIPNIPWFQNSIIPD